MPREKARWNRAKSTKPKNGASLRKAADADALNHLYKSPSELQIQPGLRRVYKNRRNRNFDKIFEAVIIAELNVLFHLSYIAVRVMRASIAVCVAPTGARLRRRGKPMNFVSDGVHRMLYARHGQ